LPWDGSIQSWIFGKGWQDFEIAVDGSLVVHDPEQLLSATFDVVGIAYPAQPLAAVSRAGPAGRRTQRDSQP
jgi:hypothetical protein